MFGCIDYAHIPDDKRRKLDKKAEKMRFVGYSLTSKGYRLFGETKRKVFVRRDVTFDVTFENDFGHKETMTRTDKVAEPKQIQLHQKQYIEKMLKKFGQTEAKTVTTPADLNVKLDGVSKSVKPTLISETLIFMINW